MVVSLPERLMRMVRAFLAIGYVDNSDQLYARTEALELDDAFHATSSFDERIIRHSLVSTTSDP